MNRIKLMRGTKANIDSVNPLLLSGEMLLEYSDSLTQTTPPRIKIGNGSSLSSALSYAVPDPSIYGDNYIHLDNFKLDVLGTGYFTLVPKNANVSSGSTIGDSSHKLYNIYSEKLTANGLYPMSPGSGSVGTYDSPFLGACINQIYCSDETNSYVGTSDTPFAQGGFRELYATDYLQCEGNSHLGRVVIDTEAATSSSAQSIDGVRISSNKITLMADATSGQTSTISGNEGAKIFLTSARLSTHGTDKAINLVLGREKDSSTVTQDTLKSTTPGNITLNSQRSFTINTSCSASSTGEGLSNKFIFKLPDGLDTKFTAYFVGADLSTLKADFADANHRLGTVYCTTLSQTSDLNDKSDVEYIGNSSQVMLYSSNKESSTKRVSTEDVINFVKSINPATYVYKKSNVSTVSEALVNDPEMIQLGLIAQDIRDDNLFNYIGSSSTDEEGNEHLSIKPLPIAVAALTTCKYLLEKVETLEAALDNSNM